VRSPARRSRGEQFCRYARPGQPANTGTASRTATVAIHHRPPAPRLRSDRVEVGPMPVSSQHRRMPICETASIMLFSAGVPGKTNAELRRTARRSTPRSTRPELANISVCADAGLPSADAPPAKNSSRSARPRSRRRVVSLPRLSPLWYRFSPSYRGWSCAPMHGWTDGTSRADLPGGGKSMDKAMIELCSCARARQGACGVFPTRDGRATHRTTFVRRSAASPEQQADPAAEPWPSMRAGVGR